ncbi:Ltp family lipoprotein [Oryzobacter telluris]|uniref:Ltp family lipoprotein n=1 Tax=Oryzobacter telluris TaxID=3149179 RepID=UPI00370D4599
MTNTPAGWYPQADGRQRYWDGAQWTEHFAPGGTQQPQAMSAAGATAIPAGASARPWFKKKRFIIPGALVGLVILGSALGGGGDTPDTSLALASSSPTAAATAEDAAATPPASTPAKPSPSATTKPAPTKAAPPVTTAQANALRSAENYLGLKGFSKKGLIQQLSSEYGDGFAKADATWAAEHLDVNWNEQAVRAGQAYLDMKGFSRRGLIEQLSSEYGDQFTVKQATYAVNKLGL